jgi:hypothetical protein
MGWNGHFFGTFGTVPTILSWRREEGDREGRRNLPDANQIATSFCMQSRSKSILVSMISERNVVGCRARPYQQCCRAIAGNSALLRTISYKKDHPT